MTFLGGCFFGSYAFEDKHNNVIWVKVYDNRYPNDANRHLTIKTSNNTWNYDMGGGLGIWSGNATTHNLGVVKLSLHEGPLVCPRCESSSEIFVSQTVNGEVWLSGEGHLLITNSQGQRIGYDGDLFVNEIPDAFESVTLVLQRKVAHQG